MLLLVGPGHVSPQFLPLQVGIYRGENNGRLLHLFF
jgi:hypothetical protein